MFVSVVSVAVILDEVAFSEGVVGVILEVFFCGRVLSPKGTAPHYEKIYRNSNPSLTYFCCSRCDVARN